MMTEFSVGQDHYDEGLSKPRQKYISVSLADPGVLDCFICYKALRSPIFQCENGHIACSSCCVKLRNKCPLCSKPIGYIRCRAIENVSESFQISCPNAPYGCEEIMPYYTKNDHDKECIYAPCFCPHLGCDFVASSKELALHFNHKHAGSAVYFVYDNFFSVTINVSDEVIVLQEQRDDNLFILNNIVKHKGNLVGISCIAPNSSKAAFHYELFATSHGCSRKLQSLIQSSQGHITVTPSFGFVFIPSDFFCCGQLKVDLCIGRNVNSSPRISIHL